MPGFVCHSNASQGFIHSCNNTAVTEPQVFRVSVELTLSGPILLPPHLGPVIYATLAEAWQRATGTPAQLPPNTWVETRRFKKAASKCGDRLLFGITTLQESSPRANELLRLLQTGIRSVASHGLSGSILGGNFELTNVVNLVTGSSIDDDKTISGVSVRQLSDNLDCGASCENVRIQIKTPLRLQRRYPDVLPGHRYLDNDCFPIDHLVTSLRQRLVRLGMTRSCDQATYFEYPSLINKKLRWQEVRYGHKDNRKSFGGVIGTLDLESVTAETGRLLALGEYVGVGELTRFGFGRYSCARLGS